jgi:uncharacterized RDD family membrane protein YckC
MEKTAKVETYNAHETERMREVHGVPLAPFWRRAAALAIDFVIAGALFMLIVYPVALLLFRLGWIQPKEQLILKMGFFQNWYSIVWLVLYFGLATYWGNGKTPGKALLRIRSVSLVHERIGLWHSIERALGYGASALEFGFGFVQYFIHPNRRTVHDRIAETIVALEAPLRKTAPRSGDQTRAVKRNPENQPTDELTEGSE